MSLQQVKDVLHEIVAATAGAGNAERLHAQIDGIGAPPPSYPAAAEPEPAAEPFPAPAETPAPTPDEPGWTAF